MITRRLRSRLKFTQMPGAGIKCPEAYPCRGIASILAPAKCDCKASQFSAELFNAICFYRAGFRSA